MQISEFQKLMKTLYFVKDQERGLTGTALWLFEEVGEIAEALRHYMIVDNPEEKTHFKKEIGREMADIFAWVSSLANLLEIDLEQVLYEKYPGKCSKCGNNPCTCDKI